MENIENKPLLKADNLETKSKPSFAEGITFEFTMPKLPNLCSFTFDN